MDPPAQSWHIFHFDCILAQFPTKPHCTWCCSTVEYQQATLGYVIKNTIINNTSRYKQKRQSYEYHICAPTPTQGVVAEHLLKINR